MTDPRVRPLVEAHLDILCHPDKRTCAYGSRGRLHYRRHYWGRGQYWHFGQRYRTAAFLGLVAAAETALAEYDAGDSRKLGQFKDYASRRAYLAFQDERRRLRDSEQDRHHVADIDGHRLTLGRSQAITREDYWRPHFDELWKAAERRAKNGTRPGSERHSADEREPRPAWERGMDHPAVEAAKESIEYADQSAEAVYFDAEGQRDLEIVASLIRIGLAGRSREEQGMAHAVMYEERDRGQPWTVHSIALQFGVSDRLVKRFFEDLRDDRAMREAAKILGELQGE